MRTVNIILRDLVKRAAFRVVESFEAFKEDVYKVIWRQHERKFQEKVTGVVKTLKQKEQDVESIRIPVMESQGWLEMRWAV